MEQLRIRPGYEYRDTLAKHPKRHSMLEDETTDAVVRFAVR
jgi:hypothetical protein